MFYDEENLFAELIDLQPKRIRNVRLDVMYRYANWVLSGLKAWVERAEDEEMLGIKIRVRI